MQVMDESLLNEEAMLTTVDNPYNPFSQWDEWYVWDIVHGYNSCGLLARVARTSDFLSDADNRLAINLAIDEIIKYDPTKMFRKAVVKAS